jgi:hypothetical protein
MDSHDRREVEALLARLDLRAMAEAAGAHFTRSGSAACPLHSGADNPTAFHLYCGRDGIWRWHCFTRCPPGQNDGDALTFYMRWRHVDFRTAWQELAGHGAGPAHAARSLAESRAPYTYPAAVGPLAALPLFWQAHALIFAAAAQKRLWSPAGRRALAYLQNERGLMPETILRWGLGWQPRDTWEPAALWGLDTRSPTATGTNPPGRSRRIWCPAGIVIPAWRDGGIMYLKVRRPLPGGPLAAAIGVPARLPGAKYTQIRGGQSGVYGADLLRGLPTLILTEGEFDALLAWQAVADLADVATLGSASRRIDRVARGDLAGASRILVAYDSDAAGAAAQAYWQAADPRVQPLDLPIPPGAAASAHDITAYWQSGGDLRGWLASHMTG